MSGGSVTRRQFVLVAAAVGGALVIGVTARRLHRAALPAATFSAFVRIDPTGHVTLISPKVKMGQGPYTSLPLVLAEEFEVDLKDISVGQRRQSRVYGFGRPGRVRLCGRSGAARLRT
jgi:isoquinoline 1-oxidoreductase beta subunit